MQGAEHINLFGLKIANLTRTQALDSIFDGERKSIAFINAHCANLARKNASYAWAMKRACLLLPDGSGMALAARMHGRHFVENLNGTDLFPHIMDYASRLGQSVFLFGSQPGIAQRAADKAKELVPAVTIAGTRHGFFKPDDETDIIAEINNSGADVVLVALGVPKQDLWIARNRHLLKAKVVFGVGAQFDFWSGRVSRAPSLLRKTGMEWIWRFAIEPRRMFRRYILGNPLFIATAAKEAVSQRLQFPVRGTIRRLFDMLLSGGALLGLAPLIGLIGLAIKLESEGPVFFTQLRVGQNGKQFRIYKFRSMYKDAEARRQAILHLSERKGVCFKSRNDPRVTRVGKFLRRFSLDELPQILNVWKGDMAIVGPRPALLSEVAVYPEKAMGRLNTKPGLTGLWQVSGRAEVCFDRMINMDLAMAKSRTVFTDIAMVLLTFRAVLTGRGAY